MKHGTTAAFLYFRATPGQRDGWYVDYGQSRICERLAEDRLGVRAGPIPLDALIRWAKRREDRFAVNREV
jgi:hypothetical protein